MESVVLDTNVFIAAGFNRHSASARLLGEIRSGSLLLLWDERTRAETSRLVGQIPPLNWSEMAELFRPEGRVPQATPPQKLRQIEDPADRKFAALAIRAGAPLVTMDNHLLSVKSELGCLVLRPREAIQRLQT